MSESVVVVEQQVVSVVEEVREQRVIDTNTAATVIETSTVGVSVGIVESDEVTVRGSPRVVVAAEPQAEVIELGVSGPQGVAGPQGPPGPPGLTYVHDQAAPSDVWVIAHNLGAFPNITIVDTSGAAVIGDESYDSADQITVRFSAPFSGKAYLS